MGGYHRSTPKAEYVLIADPIQNIPLLYTIHQLTKAEARVSRSAPPEGQEYCSEAQNGQQQPEAFSLSASVRIHISPTVSFLSSPNVPSDRAGNEKERS